VPAALVGRPAQAALARRSAGQGPALLANSVLPRLDGTPHELALAPGLTGRRGAATVLTEMRRAASAGRRRQAALVLALALALALGLASGGWASGARARRVSISSAGQQGNGSSFYPSISADGRYVAFYSDATNLVAGETNVKYDVFVYDRKTHKTRRVSVSSTGQQGNDDSLDPSISADGRYVAFYSYATNLVAGDTNGTYDIFVYDRRKHKTRRVSVSSGGQEGNGDSYDPSISADGRYVAFDSAASNLVAGDTNGTYDIFVYDRSKHKTRRVSVSSGGQEGNGDSLDPSISADGRYVAFESYASNLVAGDANNKTDVFVYDRKTHKTRRVSVTSGGQQGNDDSTNPSISADGRYVAFYSYATDLVAGDTNVKYDVFVYDRKTHKTRRVSVSSGGQEGNGNSLAPSISADGRYVAFHSYASNLVAGDSNNIVDVFVYDRRKHKTRRVSVSSGGQQGNSFSLDPSISADGRYVAFHSYASNLVAGDTNDKSDVFVYGPLG